MKSITLTQPWATLVALNAKRIETRSWRTNYQGPLAIHAAKGYPKWARELCRQEPFKSALRPLGVSIDPGDYLGMIVATCYLENVFEVGVLTITEPERSFGDYSPGRWAWLLTDITPLAKPVLATGASGAVGVERGAAMNKDRSYSGLFWLMLVLGMIGAIGFTLLAAIAKGATP